ncbi:hypothetical protein ALC53_00019 [Atta colombica]|uniref:Uncharacterized protein n=1 Tax=Atta colombica TaxID=520822 RepID=A0A151K1J6_9HYME|nr:hypothetical protein ALC53_00019 [Atta colombica]
MKKVIRRIEMSEVRARDACSVGLYTKGMTSREKNFIEKCLHFKHVNILSDGNIFSKSELSLKTIINSNIEFTFPNVVTTL